MRASAQYLKRKFRSYQIHLATGAVHDARTQRRSTLTSFHSSRLWLIARTLHPVQRVCQDSRDACVIGPGMVILKMTQLWQSSSSMTYSSSLKTWKWLNQFAIHRCTASTPANHGLSTNRHTSILGTHRANYPRNSSTRAKRG